MVNGKIKDFSYLKPSLRKRKIIKIDERKCNGCGLCIPNCLEGALQIIDGKARLISDLFCDGLGACIGHCPEGAITIEEREAVPYDEKRTMIENIIPAGENTIKAHLEHLREHNQKEYLKQALDVLKKKGIKNPIDDKKMEKKVPCGCPGTALKDLRNKKSTKEATENESELRQWPVQLTLVPPNAPYFQNADLLVAADCVPFANPNFHSKLLKGKALVIACPKLDDLEAHKEKLKSIIEMNNLNTIIVAIMEVPCCGALYGAVEEALDETGKRITLKKVVVGIDGSFRD